MHLIPLNSSVGYKTVNKFRSSIKDYQLCIDLSVPNIDQQLYCIHPIFNPFILTFVWELKYSEVSSHVKLSNSVRNFSHNVLSKCKTRIIRTVPNYLYQNTVVMFLFSYLDSSCINVLKISVMVLIVGCYGYISKK